MARAVIKRFLGDVRGGDAAIAVFALFLQRQEFQLLADHHAVGHPQRQAGADIRREGEKLKLLAQLAMVAFLGFRQTLEIGVQLLLVAPGGAIDALQLRVPGVAAPIGARDLGQLEGVADLGGGAKMRTAAEIVPVAMPIDRNVFARRNAFDQLGLVGLADVLEMLDRLVARPNFAAGGARLFDDLMHLGFDLGQVFRRERFGAGEVVIEAVLDGRARW